MTIVDIDLLFKSRLPEEDVELPGVGVVRVRGLSRAEALKVRSIEGRAETERAILALAMVDPTMTEAEVGRWQAASPAGEMEPVTDKVSELSGMLEDSAKAAYKSDGDEPGPGVRDVPRPEAGDDEGDATSVDVS